MTKNLKVIKPFFVLEEGDTLELNDNGMYTTEYTTESSGLTTANGHIDSMYQSKYSISTEYADLLKKAGFLQEVSEKGDFVNVFDEIDTLIKRYEEDLKNVDENAPICLQVEKETVLKNLIHVLNHLNSLKK